MNTIAILPRAVLSRGILKAAQRCFSTVNPEGLGGSKWTNPTEDFDKDLF